ncbi:hypothetical protein L1887_60521 [Cichorium endivia]|nr:hypothetical protein L1887_60521 [Cichorium endivia]
MSSSRFTRISIQNADAGTGLASPHDSIRAAADPSTHPQQSPSYPSIRASVRSSALHKVPPQQMSEPSEAGPSSGSQHALAQQPRLRAGGRQAIAPRARDHREHAPPRPSASDPTPATSAAAYRSSPGLPATLSTTSTTMRASAPFSIAPSASGPSSSPSSPAAALTPSASTASIPPCSEDASARTDADDDATAPRPKRCPTCRASADFSHFQPTALLIKNMVDTLRVRCPNKDKGCDHQCERHCFAAM